MRLTNGLKPVENEIKPVENERISGEKHVTTMESVAGFDGVTRPNESSL
jgi:hypothetical protein